MQAVQLPSPPFVLSVLLSVHFCVLPSVQRDLVLGIRFFFSLGLHEQKILMSGFVLLYIYSPPIDCSCCCGWFSFGYGLLTFFFFFLAV